MKIIETGIDDLFVVEPTVFEDDRGFFMESFNHEKFSNLTRTNLSFVQDNHSKSSKGVLRGLHYQMPPNAQGKLVRVASGEVLDVAVDIRQDSRTFGKWFSIKLSAENKKQLWIPAGFAHGFLTLSDSAEFLYKTTDYYAPQSERCILWCDSQLNIDWGTENPQVSQKDLNGVSFSNAELFT